MINIQHIQILNQHWQSETEYYCSYKYKRDAFEKIKPWLNTKHIISLSGLRRTGKSTLLSQLREDYAKINKLKNTEHLFFSFENEDRQSLAPVSDLEELLKYYFDNILLTPPSKLKNPILICLDELQNVDSWQKVLKTYYDLSANIKFIISGSSSLYLKESAESLVGRIMDFTIYPLSFREFLKLSNNADLKTINTLDDILSFAPSSTNTERLNLFETFLLIGGFPEAATMYANNIPVIQIQHYIRESIVNKIINKDLAKFFNLKVTEKDLLLFKVLCFESGQITNNKKLADESGFSLDSVKCHLQAMIDSGLLLTLKRFDTKPRKISNAHPKTYITSPSIVNSFLGYEQIPQGSLIGHLAESYAFMRLKELNQNKEIYFASPGRNKEIDFYLPNQKILLESKYSDYISKEDINYVVQQAKKYKLKAFLITKQLIDSTDIKSIPVSYL